MSWAIGYNSNLKRDIGYGVPAICDHPKCNERIDRGLSYLCGGQDFDEHGCGLCFCSKHLFFHTFRDGESANVCSRCHNHKKPYMPKPDTYEWIHHKATDPSWAEWRKENPEFMAEFEKLRAAQGEEKADGRERA